MLVSLGYCAPLQRLQVSSLPRPPQEGVTGHTAEPTLTCDAVMVALGLADRGYSVDGHFSAPGTSPSARALARLVETNLRYVTWGPDSGDPFELQIVDHAGQLQWFSDPSAGLRSLAGLAPPRLSAGDWLYLDDFAWLSEPLARLTPNSQETGLYVNLGRRTPSELVEGVARWHRRAQAVIVQCSVACEDPELLRELAVAGCRAGAALSIVTGGSRGLALASGHNSHSAHHPLDRLALDSAGAGTAVAITVLQYCLNQDSVAVTEPDDIVRPRQLRELAEAAARAGAEQCLVDGAVEQRLRPAWQAELAGIQTGSTK